MVNNEVDATWVPAVVEIRASPAATAADNVILPVTSCHWPESVGITGFAGAQRQVYAGSLR